jgi:hypothetical protein
MATDLDLLIGKWTVKVQPAGAKEPWTWEYEFFSGGRVTWRDVNSYEKGSGNWSASPKLVNIAWQDSATAESWVRPLKTTRNNDTWYNSSYFRGKYWIEKASAAPAPGPAPFMLAQPPKFVQSGLFCWAAGTASWLRATKRDPNATDQKNVDRFTAYLNSDGSLPEGSEPDNADALKGGLRTVFGKMGIELENIPASDFTYSYVLDKLKTKGYLVLLEQSGGSMGHTFVVYGAGTPSEEYFSVFDSLALTGGYRNRKFSEVSGGRVYVGWGR